MYDHFLSLPSPPLSSYPNPHILTFLFPSSTDNHKPDPTLNPSPAGKLHLTPSTPSTYDLTFKDSTGRYQYAGSRTSGDGQYVLIFDKIAKHFVLHRVDSTFDMNLISTPWDQDAESLRSEYGRVDPQPKANPAPPAAAPVVKKAAKAPVVSKPVAAAKTNKSAAAPKQTAAAKRAQAKAEKPTKKKAVREPTPDEDDEDEDDDDLGLTIEYPDGHAPSRYNNHFPSAAAPIFHEPVHEASEASEEDEDEDADGDFEEDEGNMDVDLLQLPSPAGNNVGGGQSPEDLLEMDLEAELERALESANGGESDEESEEE